MKYEIILYWSEDDRTYMPRFRKAPETSIPHSGEQLRSRCKHAGLRKFLI